jgi:hypothetical protein
MTYQEPAAGPQQIPPVYSQPQQVQQPVYPPTHQPQPPLPKKPNGLALAALIVGIGAFLFGLIPVFGALVGIAGIVLGVFAMRKQQSKGMAIAGIVLGGLAVLASIGTTVGMGAAVENASQNRPVAVVAETAAPKTTTPETTAPETTPEPAEETKSPEPPAAPAAPAAPAVPADFNSALKQAEQYSNLMHMSKAGLYDQLTSEYGGQFSAEAAQYAIDNVQADWNANALAQAKSYQDTMSMSPEAIRDQLASEYGGQFTQEEADYAVAHLND